MEFVINESIELVPAGKSRSETTLMVADATREIAGDTQIERSVRSIRHDVDPTGGHAQDFAGERLRNGVRKDLYRRSSGIYGGKVVGGRAKPGHDSSGADRNTPASPSYP
jgi:hypothetical protein